MDTIVSKCAASSRLDGLLPPCLRSLSSFPHGDFSYYIWIQAIKLQVLIFARENNTGDSRDSHAHYYLLLLLNAGLTLSLIIMHAHICGVCVLLGRIGGQKWWPMLLFVGREGYRFIRV